MKRFLKLLKIEGRLGLRSPDSIFFGVCMPVAIIALLGIICGSKPAFEGADYTLLQSSFGALITVGGALTQNWLAFAMPTMYEFTMSMGIDVVDKYQYFGAMAHEHVVGNQEVMDRMVKLGQNISEAVHSTGEEMSKWRGNEEGICPVCHCDMLTMVHNKNQVECPVCGISGDLTLVEGEIKVNFSEASQKRSRLFYEGKLEHCIEISTKAVGPGQIPNKKELLEKYKGYGE